MAIAEVSASPRAQMVERLNRADEAVRGAFAFYDDELQARDRLIVEATDAGWTMKDVAAAARISVPRVNQILVRCLAS